eukprot:Opistho-2@67664
MADPHGVQPPRPYVVGLGVAWPGGDAYRGGDRRAFVFATGIWIACILLLCAQQVTSNVPVGGAGLSLFFDSARRDMVSPGEQSLPATELTFEAWVRPCAHISRGVIVGYSAFDASMSPKYDEPQEFVFGFTRTTLFVRVKGVLFECTSPQCVLAGDEWRHAAVSLSASNASLTMLLDGLAVYHSTLSLDSLSAEGCLVLGQEMRTFCEEYVAESALCGGLDGVRLWRTARSASQVAADYWRAPNTTDPLLSVYYDFDNDALSPTLPNMAIGGANNPGRIGHTPTIRNLMMGSDSVVRTPTAPIFVVSSAPLSGTSFAAAALVNGSATVSIFLPVRWPLVGGVDGGTVNLTVSGQGAWTTFPTTGSEQLVTYRRTSAGLVVNATVSMGLFRPHARLGALDNMTLSASFPVEAASGAGVGMTTVAVRLFELSVDPPANATLSGSEDTPLLVPVGARDSAGQAMRVLVTSLPSRGLLYQAVFAANNSYAYGHVTADMVPLLVPITAPGTAVAGFGDHVVFAPRMDDAATGDVYDLFAFAYRLGSLVTAPAWVAVSISSLDDPPAPHPQRVRMSATDASVYITLNSTDPDGDDPPLITIAANPRFGALRQATPDATPIVVPHSQPLVQQYASAWLNVSSQFSQCGSICWSPFTCPDECTQHGWSVSNVLGPPDVYPRYADNQRAWQPLLDRGEEFVVLEYPFSIYPTGVTVYETFKPGAVVRLSVAAEWLGPQTVWSVLWEGGVQDVPERARIFSPHTCPRTVPTRFLRVDLNTKLRPGWNSIDAVGMIGYSRVPEGRIADPAGRVVYVPASGVYADAGVDFDSFSFKSEDCDAGSISDGVITLERHVPSAATLSALAAADSLRAWRTVAVSVAMDATSSAMEYASAPLFDAVVQASRDAAVLSAQQSPGTPQNAVSFMADKVVAIARGIDPVPTSHTVTVLAVHPDSMTAGLSLSLDAAGTQFIDAPFTLPAGRDYVYVRATDAVAMARIVSARTAVRIVGIVASGGFHFVVEIDVTVSPSVAVLDSGANNEAVFVGVGVGVGVPIAVLLVVAGLLHRRHAAIAARIVRAEDHLRIRIDVSELEFFEKIGEGAYGHVFRGRFRGTDVAIKRITIQGEGSPGATPSNESRVAPRPRGDTAVDARLGELSMRVKTAKKNVRRMGGTHKPEADDGMADALADFEAEVDVMVTLRHPNIVLYLGNVRSGRDLLLVTEYMERGALSETLANKATRLPFARKVEFLRDAARGLYFLHSHSPFPIVHSDIKSANFLLDRNWVVKVADFGLTALLSGDPAMEVQRGTLLWMAPEVLLSVRYDTASDVYSFGMVMFEVMARAKPFAGMVFRDVEDLVDRIVYRSLRPRLGMNWPPNYVSLMSDCWADDSTARPSFRDIVARLDALAESSLAVQSRDGLPPSTQSSYAPLSASLGGDKSVRSERADTAVTSVPGSVALPDDKQTNLDPCAVPKADCVMSECEAVGLMTPPSLPHIARDGPKRTMCLPRIDLRQERNADTPPMKRQVSSLSIGGAALAQARAGVEAAELAATQCTEGNSGRLAVASNEHTPGSPTSPGSPVSPSPSLSERRGVPMINIKMTRDPTMPPMLRRQPSALSMNPSLMSQALAAAIAACDASSAASTPATQTPTLSRRSTPPASPPLRENSLPGGRFSMPVSPHLTSHASSSRASPIMTPNGMQKSLSLLEVPKTAGVRSLEVKFPAGSKNP